MEEIVDYANGSYSTSDDGGRGDIYALAPRIYPVPHFLAEYFDLAKALRVATSTCALQQGKCWVIRRDATLPRAGQRCGRGECEWRSPNSPGFAGLAGIGTPIALATARGLAVVNEGTVLPLWQRIFRFSPTDHFIVQGPSMTYSAAVRAAMMAAAYDGHEKLVFALSDGRPVPIVRVGPNGPVRRAARAYATQVTPMDAFAIRQAYAASAGASLMPFNM